MSCDDYQQRVSEFVDEELDPGEIRPLFQHLSTCDTCWTYYRRVERLHAVASRPVQKQEIEDNEPTPSTRRVPESLEDQSVSPPEQWLAKRQAMTPAAFLLGGAVALIVGMLLTLALLPGRGESEQIAPEQWVPQYHHASAAASETASPGLRTRSQ
jgi:anti-sigma factor RsiW